jgi:hypothetical protein
MRKILIGLATALAAATVLTTAAEATGIVTSAAHLKAAIAEESQIIEKAHYVRRWRHCHRHHHHVMGHTFWHRHCHRRWHH